VILPLRIRWGLVGLRHGFRASFQFEQSIILTGERFALRKVALNGRQPVPKTGLS
jgi:hypothetical protein